MATTTDAQLDVLVAEAVKALREKNEAVGANIVAKIVPHTRARVLKAYDRLFEAEMTKKEMEDESAISPTIGAEIIKIKKNYADIVSESDKKRIEHLKCGTELLHGEIVSLQDELVTMKDQASKDRDAINDLQESTSHQKGQIQELQKQIEAKMLELLTERQKYSEIFASVAELNRTLGGKTFEAQAERTRASDLQTQRDEIEKRLKETETKRDEAGLLITHMKEKSADLVIRLQNVEQQLAGERISRLEAEKNHSDAQARADVYKCEIDAIRNAQAATRNDPVDQASTTTPPQGAAGK